ncbi:hypothetical protein DFJ73DRAFT_824085 [Zopfochytrium polystomum]|nr:hypothetical protein DFJ73DRAFT_824085 [Zopfochytrium polystomum]
MRGAALQTALEYRKEMEFLKEEAAKKLSKALELAAPAATERNEVVRALTENTSPTATPRLQRMFDAAYGRGFVDVPSKNISRLGRNAKLDLSDSTKDSSPRSDLDEGQTPDPASMIDEREEFEIKRRLEIQEHNSRHQRHHRRIVDEVSGDLSDTEHQDEVPGLTRGRSRRGRDGFDPPVLSPGKTKDKRFSRGFQPSEAPTDANKGDDTVSISSESQSEQGGVKEGKIRRPDKSLSPTRIPDPNIKRVVNVRRGVLPISPRFGAGALSLSSEAPYTAPQSPGRSNRLRSPSHPRDSSAPPPSKSISSSSSTSSSSSLSSVSPRRKSSTPALLQSSSVGLPGSVVGSRPSGMVAASPSPSPTFGMSGESISGSSNGNHQHHHHRPHSSLHEDGISRWQTLGAAEPPDGFSSWGDIAGARTAVGSEHSHYRSATKRSSKASLTDGSDHSDVFARLATSHTLASQAKVIHRDKDPPPVD